MRPIKRRIILFCDVERPMKYAPLTAINRYVSHHIVKASSTQNVDGEHVGVLNKVFGWLYEIHLAGRRVKQVEPQSLLRAQICPDPCRSWPHSCIRSQVMIMRLR